MLPTSKLCISVSEMAELLGIAKPSAYSLVKRADFPTVQIGRRLLVPVAGLERWLQEQSGY